jgi:CrcB protein
VLQKLLYLGLAGAAGTLARFWLSGVIQKNVSTEFPLGTVVVNLCGLPAFWPCMGHPGEPDSLSGQMRIVVFFRIFWGLYDFFNVCL